MRRPYLNELDRKMIRYAPWSLNAKAAIFRLKNGYWIREVLKEFNILLKLLNGLFIH
jgi:hypothetical protein